MTDTTTQAIEEALIESIGDSFSGESLKSDTEKEIAAAEAGIAFEYDADFQLKIAALYALDNRFAKRIQGLVKPSYFEVEAVGYLFDIANQYMKKYGSVPSDKIVLRDLVKDEIKSRRIRDDLGREVVKTLRSLYEVSLTDADYVAEKVGTFARHQAIQLATLRLIELNEKGDFDEAQKVMEQAFRVGQTSDFKGISYFEALAQRTELRKEVIAGTRKPNGITTGYKKIDGLLYHKGWGRKELSVLMGGAKKGKSMGLGHFAMNAVRRGYNTLYVTLEVSDMIIQERLDACLSKIPISELPDRLHEAERSIQNVGDQSSIGKFEIIEFPSGTLTPAQLRNIIERYRAEGTLFDLIVVDYADIMAPNHYSRDPIENSKQIWLGLRAIASEENAAVLTATQTNRTGFKSDTSKAEDVAEDFNKVRIADLMISINRTDEERDRGEARLYFAASRNQSGEFSLGIKQDLESMQFITAVTSIV